MNISQCVSSTVDDIWILSRLGLDAILRQHPCVCLLVHVVCALFDKMCVYQSLFQLIIPMSALPLPLLGAPILLFWPLWFICGSLITEDAEHLSICALSRQVSSLVKCPFKSSACLKNQVIFIFLKLICRHYLYRQEVSPLLVISFAVFFHFLNDFFDEQSS